MGTGPGAHYPGDMKAFLVIAVAVALTESAVPGGESLHNNHHANPRAPRFSVRSWEFDPSWPVIRALGAWRLLTIAETPVRLAGATAPMKRSRR